MILLLGCGPMAVEYAKVLKAQNQQFIVVGRGLESAKAFTEKTNFPVMTGGYSEIIDSGFEGKITAAIVAVGVDGLYENTLKLIESGIKRILIEKPAALYPSQIDKLSKLRKEKNIKLFVGYNRRFFASIHAAKNIIEEDGGVTSIKIDFTEWAHEIEKLTKGPDVKKYWILSNSSHVLDLAFHIGGIPRSINTYQANSIEWHPSGATFVACGVTHKSVPFIYHADWAAPGRWAVEINTKKHKLILCPMEKLSYVEKGSTKINDVILEGQYNDFDSKFKPGLYKQVESFLSNDHMDLCSIDEHKEHFKYYCEIAGYEFN